MEINQPEKNRGIILSARGWQKLIAAQRKINAALESNEKCEIKLEDDDIDIRVHTNMFQEKTYVHIRTWWQDKPTKKGVAMLKEEWNKVGLINYFK